jgi:hypothetical protein
MVSAYGTDGSSQFRAIMQLLRHVHPSSQRSYGSIDGLTAEVLATKG